MICPKCGDPLHPVFGGTDMYCLTCAEIPPRQYAKCELAERDRIIDTQAATIATLRTEVDELHALFQRTHHVHHDWVRDATRCHEAETQLAERDRTIGELTEDRDRLRGWMRGRNETIRNLRRELRRLHAAYMRERGVGLTYQLDDVKRRLAALEGQREGADHA